MAVSIILTFLIECVKGEARLKTFSVHIFLNWVILCSVIVNITFFWLSMTLCLIT